MYLKNEKLCNKIRILALKSTCMNNTIGQIKPSKMQLQ